MNALSISIGVLLLSIAAAFVLGAITRNYSHVDRLWSILPPVYVLIWATELGDNPRFVIAAVLVALWGIRLTANFAIKGGYRFTLRRGFYEEDYRWAHLRKKIPSRLCFELFNLVFISAFQLTLIFAFTVPLYFYGQIFGPLSMVERLLFFTQAFLLVLEAVADYQQLRFYKRRNDPAFRDDPRYQLGFNTFGMWHYSRHPNYVCEMGQWVVVYLYLHVAGGGFHPSAVGALTLILLFVGSTLMSESITASKYPAYKEWRRATPPWLPFVDLPSRIAGRKQILGRLFSPGTAADRNAA